MFCRACLEHVEDVKLPGYVSLRDLQVQSMWGATESS
jgi:hypothetical protein